MTAAVAAETTLAGEVNDNYQLCANGQIYEVAEVALSATDEEEYRIEN